MWYSSLSDFTQYDHLSKWHYFFFMAESGISQWTYHTRSSLILNLRSLDDPQAAGQAERRGAQSSRGVSPSALCRSLTAMEGTMRDPQSHPHLAKRAGSSEPWWARVRWRRSFHGTVRVCLPALPLGKPRGCRLFADLSKPLSSYAEGQGGPQPLGFLCGFNRLMSTMHVAWESTQEPTPHQI